MKVLYEGNGSPCDLCMYEPGSVGCNEAPSCVTLLTENDRVNYYFTEDKE